MGQNKGPVDMEELERLVAAGTSQREIARLMGRDRSNIELYTSRLQRTRAAQDANADRPLNPVPLGFHLSGLSTTVGEDGEIRSQSFRAKSGDEGDVVPESGSFPAPDGMFVRSVSTLVDGQTGTVKQQWVKSDKLKEDQFQAMISACKRAAIDIIPIERIPAPFTVDTDLCNLYTLTDSHVGMLAWDKEAGEDWDLKIAEQCLGDTLVQMVDAAPAAEVGIVNQLGDWLHFDSLKPVTPEHGHLLDADSRYQKVVVVAVRILRRVVDHALAKHSRVQVYMHEGNHDVTGSVWLRVLFSALYENNPRVTVEMSPLPYVAFQWGKTMLGFHHGHLSKPVSLPLLFAALFSEIWGATKKRYIHSGHLHHTDEKEHPGVKTIQHPTLAAKDAYAARGGWLSERQAMSITYHKDRGEIARGIFIPA